MNVTAALTALLVAAAAPQEKPAEPQLPPARTGPATPPPAAIAKTLWLVQPLYPGQELLVGRTEEAIAKLVPPAARAAELIGRSDLARVRLDGAGALDCLFGEAPCADPVGSLVSGMGVQRVVLIRAGQDDTGYRFRVLSFQPGSFESATAESAGSTLDKALLGALVKVVPLASTMEILSDPPGAAVLVDGERIGVTPLSTQVLPGERTVRLELAFHEAFEEATTVPVRGRLQVERKLAKLPGSLTVASEGAIILVDGRQVGKDKAELGVAAGVHKVQLTRDGYEPYETTVDVKPGEQAKVEKNLQATGWESFTQTLVKEQEAIYARGTYVAVSYDSFRLTGDAFDATSLDDEEMNSTSVLGAEPALWGVSVEYGSVWRHFGLLMFGASYFQSADDLRMGVGGAIPEGAPTEVRSSIRGGALRLVQPQLRASLWRLNFGVQGGFVGRAAHVESPGVGDYSNGFLLADLGLELHGGVRAFLVDGLFLEGAYRHSFTLAGTSDGTTGFSGGIGYAY